ncbi:fibronectin type III-like domain-contianing protein [Actinoallomurus sp. NBC_01490]|uniref:fibronectin type III-like domain-contianing protein n=1 Tax=Actinoallomurus sp. NBC_01490 TaxID=2903557 RepID=UPI002E31CF0B|nr:fibronectin type III-like domain-contianing protein [Actinoallomurus sp. NBC_01490]
MPCPDVTNRGSRAGDAVPQLYVATPFEPASAQRPVKRLEAFQKVTVAPHQTKRVSFTGRCPNSPSVATVTATVTATVHYNGKTASTSFVVHVS